MTLLLFALQHKVTKNTQFALLDANSGNPFRKVCIEHAQKNINDWRSSQEVWMRLIEASEEARKWWLDSQAAWKKAEEADRLLTEAGEEADRLLTEAGEEADRRLTEIETKIEETKGQLLSVIQSKSFRLGRALTWPLRKVLGKKGGFV
jgi:vacuolar-type H+-ATPase subunit E/Vma4